MNFNPEESFFDAQPMFVCEQATLKILDINSAATEILGYKKKKFLKKRIIDFGEQKPGKKIKDEIPIPAKKSADKIWVFKTKAGKELYFQLSAHLINYKGRPAKLVIAHNFSEIVEGKRDKKKLLSSQLDLNNFPLAEIEWDASLNIIRWSSKAEELFGYTEEEAINEKRLLEKFIHEDDLDYVRETIKETYKNGQKDVSVINRNITKNGDVIYCEWYNSLLYNSEGKVVAMYSLVHDVTAREEALDDAKRSMMSYQDLFNSISDAIYLLDKEGTIIEANEGLESTFGYKRTEVVGKHNRILAAPGKYDEERIKEIRELAHEGNPGKFEGWGKKKNGEIFPTEFLVNIGNYFGEEVIIVIERDISDRKESEEALKQREGLFSKLFNSSPIGIALLNEHREVEMVNDGFEQLFGYRENELKGLELDKLIVPEKRHDEAVRLTESSKVTEVTERRIRKDGTILDVIIYAVPVVVEKSIVGIYGIYVDITDRKKAEEQVRKSLREKEMLLAEVHHRVKNNLAVITGLLELQSYSAQDKNAKRILKDSQMRVNSIAMVHEKLYQSEDFSEVDINQYFEELTEVVHKTMKRSDVKVDIQLDIIPVKLPIIQAIPCGLLLNEIITNSYKHAFTGRKSGTITVSLSKPCDKLLLQIKDDGIGLPEQPQANIHTSLGMTLIKTLSKQLNASFDYRSEGGAIFEFKFEKSSEEEE
ncbi:PAS domain S-box protein [Gracilimonas sp.]|uniref:PAS domain S-box protein n=1 Tax=Gracilimonas sp. TaxID=1974203 RepID=UPI003BA90209